MNSLKAWVFTIKKLKKITFYQAVGCEPLQQHRIQRSNGNIRNDAHDTGNGKLTMERADTSRIRKQAVQDGMIMLIQDGIS
jgi:type II secretory ATPase GspE/PulE/Tfp pilus assembly ATPase PilB-like protein